MAEAVAADRFADQLAREWSAGRLTTVTWLNHHSALAVHQAGMTGIDRLSYVGIDGALLVEVLRMRRDDRTSADLVLPRLLPLLAGARIALVGGHRSSLDSAAEVIARDLAAEGAVIVDARDGYSELPAAGDLEPWLRSTKPDVVLVGLGAPLQEHWTAEVSTKLTSGLIITCGGFLDQVHHESYYPGWAYPLRLNWAVRLARDPRRLWRRYSIEALQALRDRHALRREIECLAGFRTYQAVVRDRPAGDG